MDKPGSWTELLFQSTLPLRGATLVSFALILSILHFNPRSPYGERPQALTLQDIKNVISIHAPLTGSDFGFTLSILAFSQFQSTLPLRGATAGCAPDGSASTISIHAPLTGSDLRDLTDDMYLCSFQSTLPLRGATEARFMRFCRLLAFQSTLPLRGATPHFKATCGQSQISIHAPLTGSDPNNAETSAQQADFNPRSPYGERQDVAAIFAGGR